jgi:CubicO group peptidase (beta-lactamase class C family)
MHRQLKNSSKLSAFFGEICPSQTPGYAWSISSSSGRIYGGSGGVTSIEPRGSKVCEETLFDLASLTKPLVMALLALRAHDAKKVNLLETVRGAGGSRFTYLQLLRHEAGFPPWLPVYGFADDRKGVMEWLLRSCPRSQAGLSAQYSCPGYILLGLLLEQKLGASLDQLFQEHVASPLGLTERQACFNPPSGLRRQVARTELCEPNEAIMARLYGTVTPKFPSGREGWGIANDGNARFLGGISGNAGLFGTLKAVEVLANAYRPKGAFLSKQALKLAWKPAGDVKGDRRTAGWKAASSRGWLPGQMLPRGSIGHEGYTGTGVWLEPGAGRTYILLANRVHPRHPGTEFGPVRAAFLRAARELA